QPSLADGCGAALLVLGFSAAWVRLLPLVGELWFRIFVFGVDAFGLHSSVAPLDQRWASRVQFSLPFVALPAGSVTPLVWSLTALITVAAFGATYFIHEENVPWSYLLRALVIIQTSALIYFALFAARFPHDVPTYTMSMLSFGVILIGMVPAVLGFTFYVFNFSIWRKLGL